MLIWAQRACLFVCVRNKEREFVCVCAYIVFVANGMLVSVPHDDQVPRYHPAQNTLEGGREEEREREREKETDGKLIHHVCSYCEREKERTKEKSDVGTCLRVLVLSSFLSFRFFLSLSLSLS